MSKWRDPQFRYHGAASHANAAAFSRRQQQRGRDAKAAAEEAAKAVNVRPINQRKEKKA